MERKINAVLKSVKSIYYCFWILPIVVVLLGESVDEWVGCYATNLQLIFLAETILILLTALCVPLALKLFAQILTKKIDKLSIADALKQYRVWSIVRLGLLALPLLMGLSVYYLMLSTKGLLCALIALTASLFCVPSEKRMRTELHIEKDEELKL